MPSVVPGTRPNWKKTPEPPDEPIVTQKKSLSGKGKHFAELEKKAVDKERDQYPGKGKENQTLWIETNHLA